LHALVIVIFSVRFLERKYLLIFICLPNASRSTRPRMS